MVISPVALSFFLLPLPQEPMPTGKGASLETSLLPLTRLGAPLLFVQPGQDPLCNAAMIRDNLDRMPAPDIRMLELPVRVELNGGVWTQDGGLGGKKGWTGLVWGDGTAGSPSMLRATTSAQSARFAFL